MLKAIDNFAKNFLKDAEDKDTIIVTHHDTDGITSAAIVIKALQRKNCRFSVKIVKNLEQDFIEKLPEDKIILFLDLASASLNYLENKKTSVYVLDHHEINKEIPANVQIVNPHLFKEEPVCSAGLSYLFAKSLSSNNKDLATLAVIGMVGDMLDQNLGKINNEILKDAEVNIKKGILLYPATRPLDKVLMYSSSFYIPGVTGSHKGAIGLLKESGIEKISGRFYKSMIELTDEEMSNLITSLTIRIIKKNTNIVGNIYIVKFFNKLEDARELSATINACSRMDNSDIAVSFCLGNKDSMKQVTDIYTTYKQYLVSALDYISNIKKIEGKEYVIINAKDKIKDTIIGTVASILSNSQMYEDGTVIVTMAYAEDKIKVSARIAGRNGINIRELMASVVDEIGGEVGGHHLAAGCLINKDKEKEFLEILQKRLEVGTIKVSSS